MGIDLLGVVCAVTQSNEIATNLIWADDRILNKTVTAIEKKTVTDESFLNLLPLSN